MHEQRRDRQQQPLDRVADHAAAFRAISRSAVKARDLALGPAEHKQVADDRADDRHELEAVTGEAEGMHHAGRVRRQADDRDQVLCLRLHPGPGAGDAHVAHGREKVRGRARAPRKLA